MLLRSISNEDWLCYYSDSGFACNKDDAGDGDGIEDDERVHYLSDMVMVMMVEVVRMMLRMTKGSII